MSRVIAALEADESRLRQQVHRMDAELEAKGADITEAEVREFEQAIEGLEAVRHKIDREHDYERRRNRALADVDNREHADPVTHNPKTSSRRTMSNRDPYNGLDPQRIILSDSPAGLRSRALDLIEQTEGEAWTDEAAERSARLLTERTDPKGDAAAYFLATGSPEYVRAFEKIIRDPARGHLNFTDEERVAYSRADSYRAAMSLTDANGGFLVPYTLDPTILLQNAGTVNPMRGVARRVTTTTDSWSAINSDGVQAEFAAEAAEVADQSPTFTEPTLIPERAHSWVFGSYEVIADANFADEVTRLFADAKDRVEATKFTLGAGHGSNEPHGIVPAVVAADDAGSHIKASATADTFAAADVYALQEHVAPRHRNRGPLFMANLSTINALRQFETSNGSHEFPEAREGRLLNWGLIENSEMDGTINAGADNYTMLAGDFTGYVIVDRLGSQVVYEPLIKGANNRPTGQAGWYFFWRTTGGLVEPSKLRVLNVT